jgi:uncharacterized membrane protein
MVLHDTDASIKVDRIFSIDILRGIVMILMLLDHLRSYWACQNDIHPTDILQTGLGEFVIRWLSNLCAPVFIFLAGTSIYISSRSNNVSKFTVAKNNIKRGIWLILIEITLISAFWCLKYHFWGIELQVLWVLGISMICMAFLQFLPARLVGAIGLAMIFLHHLIPSYEFSGLWQRIAFDLIHHKEIIQFNNGLTLFINFPLIPWVGVMAFGYSLGELFFIQAARRKRILLIAGLISIGLFIALRLLNVYGDSSPRIIDDNFIPTFMSFINFTKQPASLILLLWNIGLAFILLAFFEDLKPGDRNFLVVFGRTPLFFYILHFLIIVLLAFTWGAIINSGDILKALQSIPYSYSPLVTWLLCVCISLFLYFPCWWYYKLKFSKRYWWMFYV